MIAVVAASVFLCLLASCGIPTYLIPPAASISKTSDTTFSLNYSAETDGSGTEQVGLLLLYCVGDSTFEADKTVVSQFKTKYRPTQYDGITIDIDENTPLYSVTVSSNTYDVYAFETEGRVVSAPLYTFEITDNPANYSFELIFNDTENTITLKHTDTGDTYTLSLYDGYEPTVEEAYVHVFGAISLQGKTFSNIYWSDLKYCGSLQTME